MPPGPTPPARTEPTGGPGRWLGPIAALVPVKAFGQAKGRLAGALGATQRAELARAMAAAVVASASPLPVAVVCDDAEVATWARSRGALVVWEPGRGLNGAVEAGVDLLRQAGVERVVVAHADLPRATRLAQLAGRSGITLVPDRRRDGTNVIVVDTSIGFRFSYGPGSFERHRAETNRLAVTLHIVEDPALTFDLDWPTDLADLAGLELAALVRRTGNQP